MDWQIVDPDLGLNYNAEFSTGDLHFEMEKYMDCIHRSYPNCNAK